MSYFDFLPQELIDAIFIYTDIKTTLKKYSLFRITLNNKYNIINKILRDFPMINTDFIQLENNIHLDTIVSLFEYLEEINNMIHKTVITEEKNRKRSIFID